MTPRKGKVPEDLAWAVPLKGGLYLFSLWEDSVDTVPKIMRVLIPLGKGGFHIAGAKWVA